MQFTVFADYLDANTGKNGFDQNDNTVFGGVTYTEGLALINSIWQESNHHGKHDLLLALKHSGQSELTYIFDNITQDVQMSGAQTALDTYSHADFVTYLKSASAGNSTICNYPA